MNSGVIGINGDLFLENFTYLLESEGCGKRRLVFYFQ